MHAQPGPFYIFIHLYSTKLQNQGMIYPLADRPPIVMKKKVLILNSY